MLIKRVFALLLQSSSVAPEESGHFSRLPVQGDTQDPVLASFFSSELWPAAPRDNQSLVSRICKKARGIDVTLELDHRRTGGRLYVTLASSTPLRFLRGFILGPIRQQRWQVAAWHPCVPKPRRAMQWQQLQVRHSPDLAGRRLSSSPWRYSPAAATGCERCLNVYLKFTALCGEKKLHP